MTDQQAKYLLFANPLGDLRLEAAHKHVELIGCFAVREVGDFAGSINQDVLHHRHLFVEGAVEFVLLCLCFGEWLDGIRPFHLSDYPKIKHAKQTERKSFGQKHAATLPKPPPQATLDQGLRKLRVANCRGRFLELFLQNQQLYEPIANLTFSG